MTQLKDLNLVKVFKTAEFGITPKINREIALWISKYSPIILSISSTSFNKGKNNSDVLYLSIIYKLNTDEMAPERRPGNRIPDQNRNGNVQKGLWTHRTAECGRVACETSVDQTETGVA